MNDVISKLVTEIGTTMKDFASGKLSLPAAEEAYERLLGECEQLEEELTRKGATEILHGILYYHNVHNCCLHSGVYIQKRGTVMPVAWVGDSSMTGRIAAALSVEHADAANDLICLGGERTGFASHVIYAKKIKATPEPLLFAALSSSNHFTRELFNKAGNILSIVFQRNACPVQQYSYFNEIRKNVDDYIDRHVDKNHDIHVAIFIFRNIEKIFSHMGFHTLLDVSKQITNTLASAFPADSLCVNPSLRMYVMFIPSLRGREEEIKKIKVEFYYDGLSLPFQRLDLPLDMKSNRERLWYDIFQFENYIITGDALSCGEDR